MSPARPLLSRDQIVAAAIDLLDRDGPDAFSMRRLGAALQVDPMAVYHHLPYGDEHDIEWIRASSAIPVATRPVVIEGHKYLDGGVADSIPSAWLFARGYDRNIVVLTQPAGFVKQPNSVMPMLRRVFRHYPEFVAALEHRHEVYNTTLDDLARREAAGDIFVVRPSESVKVPSLCREPDELERIYQVGRRDAEAALPALEAYLAG